MNTFDQQLSLGRKSFCLWTTFDHNFLMFQLKEEEKMPQFKGLSRLNWQQEEEKYLRKLYIDEGVKSWKDIADYMKTAFPDRSRTPKQYRERFTNYIRFQGQRAQRGSWTPDEDKIIFEKYMQLGSKWVQISKMTPGRSENNVKNRFYSALRKMVRRINVVMVQNKKYHNIRKPIKQGAVFKLLQTQNITSQIKDQEFADEKSRNNFILELKHDCLEKAMVLDRQVDPQQMLSIGTRLHRFNTITRFECLRKSRKSSNLKRRALPPIPMRNIEKRREQKSNRCQKQSMQEQRQEKTNKSTEQGDQGTRNEFLKEAIVESSQIYVESNKYRQSYDLQFELCQILGIQYQPQQFFCL